MPSDRADESWEDDSGPFCRHFGDPCDCDEDCANCGHTCSNHDQDGGEGSDCNVPRCECPGWKEIV